MSGLPGAKATTVTRFATHAGEPGVIYAANNRGFFRSGDAGRSWKPMDLPWPGPGLADGVAADAWLPAGYVTPISRTATRRQRPTLMLTLTRGKTNEEIRPEAGLANK